MSDSMLGNLREILIILIKSKQIREESGESLLPVGLSACLFNDGMESVPKMRSTVSNDQ